jgi:hypothetical protein
LRAGDWGLGTGAMKVRCVFIHGPSPKLPIPSPIFPCLLLVLPPLLHLLESLFEEFHVEAFLDFVTIRDLEER